MGWLGGLVVHKSQVRTRYVYGYRVHLEAGQKTVRSMKLPLAAYSTDNSAAMGAWVLLEPKKQRADRGHSRKGRAEVSAGRFKSSRERPAVSRSTGRPDGLVVKSRTRLDLRLDLRLDIFSR